MTTSDSSKPRDEGCSSLLLSHAASPTMYANKLIIALRHKCIKENKQIYSESSSRTSGVKILRGPCPEELINFRLDPCGGGASSFSPIASRRLRSGPDLGQLSTVVVGGPLVSEAMSTEDTAPNLVFKEESILPKEETATFIKGKIIKEETVDCDTPLNNSRDGLLPTPITGRSPTSMRDVMLMSAPAGPTTTSHQRAVMCTVPVVGAAPVDTMQQQCLLRSSPQAAVDSKIPTQHQKNCSDSGLLPTPPEAARTYAHNSNKNAMIMMVANSNMALSSPPPGYFDNGSAAHQQRNKYSVPVSLQQIMASSGGRHNSETTATVPRDVPQQPMSSASPSPLIGGFLGDANFRDHPLFAAAHHLPPEVVLSASLEVLANQAAALQKSKIDAVAAEKEKNEKKQKRVEESENVVEETTERKSSSHPDTRGALTAGDGTSQTAAELNPKAQEFVPGKLTLVDVLPGAAELEKALNAYVAPAVGGGGMMMSHRHQTLHHQLAHTKREPLVMTSLHHSHASVWSPDSSSLLYTDTVYRPPPPPPTTAVAESDVKLATPPPPPQQQQQHTTTPPPMRGTRKPPARIVNHNISTPPPVVVVDKKPLSGFNTTTTTTTNNNTTNTTTKEGGEIINTGCAISVSSTASDDNDVITNKGIFLNKLGKLVSIACQRQASEWDRAEDLIDLEKTLSWTKEEANNTTNDRTIASNRERRKQKGARERSHRQLLKQLADGEKATAAMTTAEGESTVDNTTSSAPSPEITALIQDLQALNNTKDISMTLPNCSLLSRLPLLCALPAEKIVQLRLELRQQKVGVLISSIRGIWNGNNVNKKKTKLVTAENNNKTNTATTTTTVNLLEAYMQTFGYGKLKRALQDVPDLLLGGQGGNTRAFTTGHWSKHVGKL